jgi:ABC-type nitrate/sulfonate/bicarbonate transport system substrate-binding protein
VRRRFPACSRQSSDGGDCRGGQPAGHGAKKGSLEKTKLKIGFIPMPAPLALIMAKPLGFYDKQGLDVGDQTAGWRR